VTPSTASITGSASSYVNEVPRLDLLTRNVEAEEDRSQSSEAADNAQSDDREPDDSDQQADFARFAKAQRIVLGAARWRVRDERISSTRMSKVLNPQLEHTLG
jgi:hypothetical protein